MALRRDLDHPPCECHGLPTYSGGFPRGKQAWVCQILQKARYKRKKAKPRHNYMSALASRRYRANHPDRDTYLSQRRYILRKLRAKYTDQLSQLQKEIANVVEQRH